MWTEYHFQELLHRGKVFTVSYISVKKCYRMLSCRCFRWVFRVWGVKVPVKRFLIVKKNNYYFRIPAIVLENIGIKLNQTICLNFGFLGVPEDSNNFLCVIWNQSNAFYSSPSDSLLFAQIRETIYFPTETRDVLLIKFVIPQSKNFFLLQDGCRNQISPESRISEGEGMNQAIKHLKLRLEIATFFCFVIRDPARHLPL